MKLLIIDDEPDNHELVRAVLENSGLDIHAEANPRLGIQLVRQLRPEIILLDLMMPGVQGMEVLEEIVEFDPGIDVILMTGNYSTESAVEAIQKGASDYLPKPFSVEKLRQQVGRLIEDAKRRQRGAQLENDLAENFELEGLIGRSLPMLELFSKLRRIAAHFRSVLVTGPTGAGKELVARALHRLSPARQGPFVATNCSSITETLAESELFGHTRGAFTGAIQDKMGVFEYANGGCALLDEIGDMPLSMQAKLLRVLQNREVQRVGSPAVRPVDVRVIAATNCDLPEMVRAGKFRQDLYFRLSMVELRVPALADRPEDLPLLERHFLKRFASQYERPFSGLTRRAQTLLARYPWPGNVRELENVIGHACIMASSNVIDVSDLPESVQGRGTPLANSVAMPGLVTLEKAKQLHAQNVLSQVGGNKVRAAEILGISRTQLYSLIREGQRTPEEQQDDLAHCN
jgi:DNA-binding NtrC family response regulator